MIADNDDDFNLNFGVCVILEKGKTYVLASRLYNPMKKASYDVSVAKPGSEATAIVPEKTEYLTYVGEHLNIGYTLEPYFAADETVEITDIDGDAVDSTGGCAVVGAKEGTATVTLTSDSGLNATVKVTVAKPKALALNTPYSSSIANYGDEHKFVFTPAESGNYTVKVDSDVYAHLEIEDAFVNYAENMELYGYLEKDREYAINLISDSDTFDYSINVTKTSVATDFYLYGTMGGTQTTHYSQDIRAEGVDGILEGTFEWSVDNEEIAVIMPTSSSSTFLSFNKEGTVTVSAKWNGITHTYTVTGKAPATIAIDDPHTETVTGFNNSVYAEFTPETSGMYMFTSSDSAEAPLMLYVDGHGQSWDGSYKAYLNENQTYFVYANRYQVASDFDENITGDITIAVKECSELEGIVIDGGDTVTGYIDNNIYLNVLPTSDDAVINETVFWSVEGLDKSEYSLEPYGEGASLYIYKEGEFTVSASSGDFTDTIKVKVISPETIKLGEKKTASVSASKIYHVVKLDAAAGMYKVRVKSDNPICVESAFSSYGGDVGTDVEIGVASLSLEPTYITIYGSETADATFTVEILPADKPMGVRPIMPEVTLNVGEDHYPYLIFEPSDLREDIETMTSSDTKVVEIEYDSIVAVGEGTATVEITTDYGLKTKVKVTVVGDDYDWAEDVTVNKDEISLTAGASEKLTATVVAESKKTVLWSSADQSVARVDANGRVTGIAEGTTYVYAMVDGLETMCKVTVTAPEIQDSTKKFSDVKAGKWYSDAIDYAYSYGFIKGTTSTTFERETKLNRAMFITILARIAGVDTTTAANKAATTKFKDVKTGKYYTAAIKWANENGIVNGTSDTAFSPEANISRQDLCVMVERFAKYMNIELKETAKEIKFKDASSIRKYAKNAVNSCQKAGIIKGYNDGTFRPENPATRAEAAQILYVFHSQFIAK